MTHTIKHQFDEIAATWLPGLEVHIIYHCESEIEYNDDGLEESNRLISLSVSINGQEVPDAFLVFPNPEQGQDAKKFLALARECARQALWAEALRQAKKFSFESTSDLVTAAERYLQTGSAK